MTWIYQNHIVCSNYIINNLKGETMASKNQEAHWSKTSGLMKVTLALWFFFGYVIFMFGYELNQFSFLGYPLAYYMTAQGSLVAFVIILFWSTGKQQQIDEEHGVSDAGRND